MNNKIIAGVVALVVIAAGVYYFVNRTPTDQSMVFTDNKGEMRETSIKDLIAEGRPTWCVFSTVAGDTTSSGTVYIADGKMRGDFNTVTGTKTTDSHMILKDGTSYVWSSEMEHGMKMSVSQWGDSGTSNDAPLSYDDTTTYECKPWNPSPVSFELPSGVTFMDLAEMMQGAGAGAAGSGSAGASGSASASLKAQQCAACNQLSGAQKTQCLSALSCSQ